MRLDIEDVLALEIKKELADRYFGFRKLIESDKRDLARKVQHQTLSLEQQICFDLVRIYILLKDDLLIRDFLALTGLEEKLFYDPYIIESPTIRRRVLAGVKVRGLTRAGRFKNLVLDSYQSLVDHVARYREQLGELVEDREVINEEIKLFHQKHDIGSIMGFLRGLNGENPAASGPMQGGMTIGMADAMAQKQQIESMPPMETMLPIIPPLIPVVDIRQELKRLTELAYQLHDPALQADPTR